MAISLLENSETPNENPLFSHKREQKSKQDLDVLLGTWGFSYSIGEMAYNSRVELTKIIYSDEYGFSMAMGKFYQDKKSEVAEDFGCTNHLMDHELNIRAFNVDFTCNVELPVSPYKLTFIFNMTGNNLSKGLFSYGDTNDEVGENLVHNNFPFMGSSAESNGSTVNGDTLEAFYYIIQDELDIPVVNYQGSNYRVILKNEGDFIFSIKYVLPTALTIEGDQPVYNESNHELTIPVVNFDGSKYRIVLENKGDFIFSIKEVQSL